MAGCERDEFRSVGSHIDQRRAFLAVQAQEYRLWWAGSCREAKVIQRLLSESLAQQGFDYIFSLDGGKVRKKVKIAQVEIRPDEYLFKVDTRPGKLPRGVTLLRMTDEEVIRQLEVCLGKPMQYHLSEFGLWYRIFRESGLRNIPWSVKFTDMINVLDARKHGPLEVALGYGENRRPIKFDFQDDTTAHMIIAGSTGTGKTNLIHAIINTLLRQDPAKVKLILIDLKRTEFGLYNGLPHLIRPVVTDFQQVLDTARMLHDEMMRRQQLMESGQGTTPTIGEWNRRNGRGNPLQYWVMVFDEIAILTDKRTQLSREVIEIFADLGRLGRAVGIHCVLATQRPDSSVILPQLKTNFPGKIALACASIADSKVVIDTGDACFKEQVPAGRAVFARGRFRIHFQCAFVPMDLRQTIIQDAHAGRFAQKRPTHDVTVAELARYGLSHYNGVFDWRKLGATFSVRGITYHEVRELSQMHRGEPFKMDGTDYILCQRAKRQPVHIETLEVHNAHIGTQSTEHDSTPGDVQAINDLASDIQADSAPGSVDPIERMRQGKKERSIKCERAFIQFLIEHPSASFSEAGEMADRSARWGQLFGKKLERAKQLVYGEGEWTWHGPDLEQWGLE